MQRGVFIVLEGSDGSGKSTQFNLLSERLKAMGYELAVFDFPRYNEQSSYFVRQYLSGKYGSAADISPYSASLFYALDRFEASKQIKKALDEGKVVLADRYVGANMAYQGAKFDDPVEQRGFFVWEDNLEYQLLNIPRPDISLYLRVPAKVSKGLISSRSARTGIEPDEHEKDDEFLRKSVATYDLLCQLFPKDFRAIECTQNGELMSIPKINNRIWEAVKPLLPADKPNPSHSVVVTLGASDSDSSAQPEGDASDQLSQAYQNASLMLRLQIQRQAAVIPGKEYLKWSGNDYEFFTPQGLPREISRQYKQSLQRLAELHSQISRKLGPYLEKNLLANAGGGKANTPGPQQILLPLTPLAALSSFKLVLREPQVKKLASKMLDSDLEEIQWAAKQLYIAARQKWPTDFKQALEPASGPESINNIIAKLAEERLPLNSAQGEQVKLLEALPRQEFDLLAESIYPYSNLSLNEITEEVSEWAYPQKYDSLKSSLSSSASALSNVRYKLDVISDQLSLARFASEAVLNNLQVQSPTPRYGYDIPVLVEDAGLDDEYLECFDESLKLYSVIQGSGREDLAGYATLMGHRVRWQCTVDAKNLKTAFDADGDDEYRRLTTAIKERVSETHPLIWEVLSTAATTPSRASHSAQNGGGNRVKASKRRRGKKSPSKPTDK